MEEITEEEKQEITEEEKQELYLDYCIEKYSEGYKPLPKKIWWEGIYNFDKKSKESE